MRVSAFFFFNDTATTEIYTLSLHDALPIWRSQGIELTSPSFGVAHPVINVMTATNPKRMSSRLALIGQHLPRLMYHKIARFRWVTQVIRQNLGDALLGRDGNDLHFADEFRIAVHQKFGVGLDTLVMAQIHHDETPFALHHRSEEHTSEL